METCVVVGAGPGLGTALAKRFARGGFAVALVARSHATVDAAVEAVRAIGGEACGYACDATDTAALERTLAQVATGASPPSVGIFNVAASKPGSPTTIDPEDVVREYRGNVVGAHVMARAFAPAMRAAGRGTLLFTGGGLAVHPSADEVTLSLGKAGLRALALMLAEELEPAGIHAATVTIYGRIEAASRFDPGSIAERFWAVHAQRHGVWTREEAFR